MIVNPPKMYAEHLTRILEVCRMRTQEYVTGDVKPVEVPPVDSVSEAAIDTWLNERVANPRLRKSMRAFYYAGRQPRAMSGDAEFHSYGGE